MFDVLKRQWLRLLRVPAEPGAPRGEGSLRIFRAAPRFYTWRLVKWGGAQLVAVSGIVISDAVIAGGAGRWAGGVSMVVWAVWSLQVIISYAILRLDYEQRWYILTDRSLRIREGVLRLHEKTMTFANIQHLTVKQGPLQRFLGISDLEVRTAGGGGSGAVGAQGGQTAATASTHIAYFRGVDNAEEIRIAIRDRIRLYRDAGLGDPDDELTGPVPPELIAADLDGHAAAALLSGARALSAEARALREALSA